MILVLVHMNVKIKLIDTPIEMLAGKSAEFGVNVICAYVESLSRFNSTKWCKPCRSTRTHKLVEHNFDNIFAKHNSHTTIARFTASILIQKYSPSMDEKDKDPKKWAKSLWVASHWYFALATAILLLRIVWVCLEKFFVKIQLKLKRRESSLSVRFCVHERRKCDWDEERRASSISRVT